jgi:hypothetical protein
LEEGCKNFSNIHGLTYILFPRNGISAKYTLLRQAGRQAGITVPQSKRLGWQFFRQT